MEARHNGLPSQEHIHHYLLQKKRLLFIIFCLKFREAACVFTHSWRYIEIFSIIIFFYLILTLQTKPVSRILNEPY